MTEVVYDAAVHIAADRNDRRIWADHRALLEDGGVPMVPAPVVAIVVPLDEAGAHAAGRLLAASGRADVVDASLVPGPELRAAGVDVEADDAKGREAYEKAQRGQAHSSPSANFRASSS
jgi:hypothetical protein